MESDQFFPEFWPANKLIGELEGVLVRAKDIIGQITNSQIESLAASKLLGKLTNAQIEEIEAAKISGLLTSAQIQELEAAKIAGQIVNSQIGPEAVNAPKLAANSVTAEKILAEAVTAVKLAANSVTAEKILAEAITAVKIAAGAVTAAKIAAGAVTAEKISVKELSAITANVGTVTAGILRGVTFETLSQETVINSEGIQMLMGTTSAPSNPKRIRWKKEGTTSYLTEILSYIFEKNSHLTINQGATSSETTASASIGAVYTPKGLAATVGFSAGEKNQEISLNAGIVGFTLWTGDEKSGFLQVSQVAKQKYWGIVGTLPLEPVKGDFCHFIADKTNGVLWAFVYDGEGEFPWKKIGGPPMFNEVNKQEGTASAAYVNLATLGPELTNPLAGEYLIGIGAANWNNTANCHARMGISIGGAEPTIEIDNNQPTAGAFSAMNTYRQVKVKLEAKKSLQAKYRQISGGEAAFNARWLAIDPIRVK